MAGRRQLTIGTSTRRLTSAVTGCICNATSTQALQLLLIHAAVRSVSKMSLPAAKALKRAKGLPALWSGVPNKKPKVNDSKKWVKEQFRFVIRSKSGDDGEAEVIDVANVGEDDSEDVVACCKHCEKELSGKNATRMKDHLLNRRVCSYLESEHARNNKDNEVQNMLATGIISLY